MNKIDIAQEKYVIEKINARLSKFKTDYSIRWIGYSENQLYNNIVICGNCIGRRYWDNILQLVNSFDYSNVSYFNEQENIIDRMYKPFWGFSSQTLDELIVKLDLNDI